MKTPRFLLLAGISLATMLTVSCDSLSKFADDLAAGLKESLQFNGLSSSNLLQNGRLGFAAQEGIPPGQVEAIESVQVSGSALAGNTTIFTVTSSEELEELYLQIDGENGFYQWILDDEKDLISTEGGKFIYQIVLEFNRDQQIEDGSEDPNNDGVITTTRTFTISGKTKGNKEVVVPEEKTVEVKQVGTGALQISLSWDQLDDVDLYVFTPSNETLFYGRKQTRDGSGKLDIDANQSCTYDDPNWGKNSENIFFEKPLENGKYTVVVNLWKKCTERHTSLTGATAYVSINGKLVTDKGIKFSDSEPGIRVGYLESKPTSSSSHTKIIGIVTVEDGKYAGFEPN